MSVHATSWVWKNSQTKGAAFTVMLCLAQHWSEQTGFVFLYVSTIARECRITARGTRKAIAQAIEAGELEVEYGAGGIEGRAPQCSRYYLPFMQPKPGAEPAEWSTSVPPEASAEPARAPRKTAPEPAPDSAEPRNNVPGGEEQRSGGGGTTFRGPRNQVPPHIGRTVSEPEDEPLSPHEAHHRSVAAKLRAHGLDAGEREIDYLTQKIEAGTKQAFGGYLKTFTADDLRCHLAEVRERVTAFEAAEARRRAEVERRDAPQCGHGEPGGNIPDANGWMPCAQCRHGVPAEVEAPRELTPAEREAAEQLKRETRARLDAIRAGGAGRKVPA